MQKSAGIISLIGGILGFCAAVFTLIAGGFVSGLENLGGALEDVAADKSASESILLFGWLGLVCAFGTIIFGALTMNTKKIIIPFILFALSIAGAIFGGTFVAVCMILCFVGGILGMIGVRSGNKLISTSSDAPDKSLS